MWMGDKIFETKEATFQEETEGERVDKVKSKRKEESQCSGNGARV